MATYDFGPATVITCEKRCFSGMQQTNRYYSVKPIVKQRCHVDLWATDLRYVIQKFGGARLFGEARVFGRIQYINLRYKLILW